MQNASNKRRFIIDCNGKYFTRKTKFEFVLHTSNPKGALYFLILFRIDEVNYILPIFWAF